MARSIPVPRCQGKTCLQAGIPGPLRDAATVPEVQASCQVVRKGAKRSMGSGYRWKDAQLRAQQASFFFLSFHTFSPEMSFHISPLCHFFSCQRWRPGVQRSRLLAEASGRLPAVQQGVMQVASRAAGVAGTAAGFLECLQRVSSAASAGSRPRWPPETSFRCLERPPLTSA